CPAVTPTGYDQFLNWLEAGYAGEMHYLEERKQAYQHPRSVLPEVTSILMLGMHYRTEKRTQAGHGQGRIARYAWGNGDYHDLIHKRLKQLKRTVQSLDESIVVRGVVDTAPLLEREFAQLAGIGWRAKNTLLINKHSGSWFFLSALLLSAKLEYDSPIQHDHCGTCTACLDACPTDAFVSAGVLDATRCISYLTIEHRTQIPRELRPQMQDWILGCDICQDVCPWNRKSPKSPEAAFAPLDQHDPIDLRSLFEITDEQFRARFRKTPLWRPKRRGILRNAAIALGNRPSAENLTALTSGLSDKEPLVRGASAWALGQHSEDEATCLLQQHLKVESDPDVQNEIETALGIQ
ncbi:MAG: tRNA epoxyqueuosine(34) reductase QueG, partial [Mariniblastus sp.]|nr:tRNA epoxyqueuosine(34) reductase QueG [Mariniblastus sp.]